MTKTDKKQIRIDISALKISKDFRLIFSAGVISNIGSMMTYVAMPFQIKEITNSYLWVGAVGLVETLPLIIFGLYGGVLADAFDRRKLILISEFAAMIVSIALLVNVLSGFNSPVLILFLAAIFAATDGIFRPAVDATTPQVVPYTNLPSAGALNSLRHQTASIAGPMIGGLILAAGGISLAYFIDVLTFVISLILLLKISPAIPSHGAENPSLKRIKEGISYALSRKDLLGTYLVDLSAMFFAFPYALFPFVADELGGAWTLGFLYAAIPSGALVATLTSGWSNHVSRHGRIIAMAACGWGLGIFRGLIWNQSIPDHLRGRLASIEMLSYSVGPQLGQVRGALFARFGGLEFSLISGGILTIISSVFFSSLLKDFYKYDVNTNVFAKNLKEFREKNVNFDPNI
ncbi:MAG: MFS transporter [Actinobacteria bacterium]|nr:MFS transporter [Actinomycetota bacterium]